MAGATDRALRLLTRVLAPLDVPVAIRLWDGTTAALGADGAGTFTVVFKTPGVLRRLLRRPTSLRFGEAFVSGAIDVEGDIFAAMAAAGPLEALALPLRTRLAVFAGTFLL